MTDQYIKDLAIQHVTDIVEGIATDCEGNEDEIKQLWVEVRTKIDGELFPDTAGAEFLPRGYKTLSPFLPGEPTFTIRAKDNFSVPMLRLLQNIYLINNDVIAWFQRWRNNNTQFCQDPD